MVREINFRQFFRVVFVSFCLSLTCKVGLFGYGKRENKAKNSKFENNYNDTLSFTGVFIPHFQDESSNNVIEYSRKVNNVNAKKFDHFKMVKKGKFGCLSMVVYLERNAYLKVSSAINYNIHRYFTYSSLSGLSHEALWRITWQFNL